MPGSLVLWDVDHTLAGSGGIGVHAYQLAFREHPGHAAVVAAIVGRQPQSS